jgi:hypothetical protein
MKTQLIEDIGQSAELPLAPPGMVGNPNASKEVHKLAPEGNAQPARPRSALGVWRETTAGEPPISTTQQPGQQPAPVDFDKVFEEIAALEAQYVPPAPLHGPAAAPVKPRRELPAPPVEPTHEPAIPVAEATPAPAIPVAEATPAPTPAHGTAAPQAPVFDFTPPSPAIQTADPFTPAGTGSTRSRQRHLLWAACALSAGLLALGGRWWYQERNEAAAPALVAHTAKEAPHVDRAVEPAAVAAKEARPAPVGDARAAAVPDGRPPLVVLEPDPPAAIKVEQTPPPVAGRAEPQASPEPEAAAEQEPASPPAKPASRTARKRSEAAAGPALDRGERKPVRQLARAPATGAKRPSDQETTMDATLRACREHGYHAAQCIKRECSVTSYGFVCRGR